MIRRTSLRLLAVASLAATSSMVAVATAQAPPPPPTPTPTPTPPSDAPWNRVAFGSRFDPRFVEVGDDGSILRSYRDVDYEREHARLRALADANAHAAAVWTARIFVLRSIDADWTGPDGEDRHAKVTFDDTQVDAFRTVAARFVDDVRVFSGGNARLDATVTVLDEPLTALDDGAAAGYPDVHHPWTGAIDPLIAEHVPAGEVDSVLVFWPGGDIPHANIWGLTAPFVYRGAGYSWVVHLGGAIDTQVYAEVALHEWLHQVEGARAVRQGYTGMPALHDTGPLGYAHGRHHPGWMTWYRDFMRWYMTPAMWRRSSMLRDARPGPRFDGGFVQQWLVAGPFPSADGHGLRTDFIDEATVRPTVDAAAGDRAWQLVDGAPRVDFDRLLSPNDQVVAYAHTWIHADFAVDARLWLGSDDGAAVWLNGQRVWFHPARRGLRIDEDQVPLYLKPGWNRLLVKVDEGGGAWAMQARLTDPDGAPLAGIHGQADHPEDGEIVERDDEPIPPSARWRLRFFSWDAVRDDPWRLLPELDVARLRALTGDPELQLATDDGRTTLSPGAGRRPAPFDAVAGDAGRRVDNAIDFAADRPESVAWLRYVRAGVPRDLLLVRPDVADFWLEQLDAREDPSVTVVGKVTAGNRPLVAVETRLWWDADRGAPPSELHLLRGASTSLAVNLLPKRGQAARGDGVPIEVVVANLGAEPVDLTGVTISGAVEASLPIDAPRLLPGARRTLITAPALAAAGALGAAPLRATVAWRSAASGDGGEPRDTSDLAVIDAVAPATLALRDASGRPFRAACTGEERALTVIVRNARAAPLIGELQISAPPTWNIEGDARPVELATGAGLEHTFLLTAPRDPVGTTAVLGITVAGADGDLSLRAEVALRRSAWQVIGPFPNADGGGFATAYPPEAGFAPDEACDGVGGPVQWADWLPVAAFGADGSLSLAAALTDAPWVTGYARADLEAGDALDAELAFGSDDTLRVWLGDREVLNREIYRPCAPGQDRITVPLGAGLTPILLKIGQGTGDWRFHVATPSGCALRGPR